jgi:hypothetical protein
MVYCAIFSIYNKINMNYNFYFNTYSSAPKIRIDLEKFTKEYNLKPNDWENTNCVFSMVDRSNGNYVIANECAKIVLEKREMNGIIRNSYFIEYMLDKDSTSKSGVYLGQFMVDFLDENTCGTVTIPNGSKIFVYITDSITKTTII